MVADFQMLLQFEMSTHSTVVLERVGEVEVAGVTPDDDTSGFRSDLVMKVSSLLRSEPQRRRIKEPRLVGEHRWGLGLWSGEREKEREKRESAQEACLLCFS